MNVLLILLLIPLTLMVLYLDVLSVAALLWRRNPPLTPPQTRFAVLVPAHNEELHLPRLLKSIAGLDYPRDLYDVHVVADNCTDGTAQIARASGAHVLERFDEELRGKGYAIRSVLAHIRHSGRSYDGYVIVDADSVVYANFLTVMNRHLVRGDQAVQSINTVLNRKESWISGMSYIALVLYTNLRPRGRDTLGLSAGLHGNGMCFTSAIVERFGWEAFSLAEDGEFHLQLVRAGLKVRFAPGTTVLAEQPTSMRQARSQGVRWERGRLQAVRDIPGLFIEAIRRRNPSLLDNVAGQIVPPFSILTGAIGLAFVVTGLLHAEVPFVLASGLVAGELLYMISGLVLVSAGPREYLSLLGAPVFAAWKVWIVLAAATHIRDDAWVRTARVGEDKPSDA